MKLYYTDQYSIPLPDGHRFPIEKYAMLRERILASHLAEVVDFQASPAASDEEIVRAHDPVYWQRLRRGKLSDKEIRRIGLPWSPTMVERARRSAGATTQACRVALKEGVAVNLGGGTHHASKIRGQGFCFLNDTAIAVRALQAEGLVRRAVIMDCDVHQGNGTASIFKNDSSAYTFSIHGRNNFPFKKEESDLDVALEDDADDNTYLTSLEIGLKKALPSARAQLCIYLAGADPFKEDRFGRLSLTKQGLAERDRMVLRFCQEAALPVAVVMAGGYAPNIEDTVDIHFQTIAAAAEFHHRGQFFV